MDKDISVTDVPTVRSDFEIILGRSGAQFGREGRPNGHTAGKKGSGE